MARFIGYLDEEAGEASARAFLEIVGSDQVVAVFDIREMRGYASASRRTWARELGPIRGQIERIELIGGNPLVRMGGSVLGALLGISVVAIKRDRDRVA